MSDSMRVDQILNQIRSIREQTMDVAQTEKISTEGLGSGERVEFSSLLKESIDAVNATQQQASEMAAAFERGDPNVSLNQVMVNMQKADVSFKAVMEVRNKFVDAYQEVMRMSM